MKKQGMKKLLPLLLLCMGMSGCGQQDKLARHVEEYEQQEMRDLQKQLGDITAQTPTVSPSPSVVQERILEAPVDSQSEMTEEKPEYITGLPEKKMRQASFETKYSGSSEARSHNIEHAAKLLDGITIEPGEVFSCSKAIGPITEENGYQAAGTYVAGKVEKGIGGGVCQISSTLYNTALLAGVTVVERAPHSMVVSYVEPARDAAIAGDYKDLKLRNDFDTAIRLEASAEDGTLRFTIHTQEEADTEIELVSEILSETDPGEPVITVDETQESDYYKVTQKAHTGYVAELYRVISRNGEEISREKVNTSTYEAVPEYVTVGGRAEE